MDADEPASILPAGTVTFLLTDAHAAEVVHAVVTAHGGAISERQGPGHSGDVAAAFGSAADALAAAVDIQRTVADRGAHGPVPQPRIGLHTGEALLRDDRCYIGPAVQRCARLRDIANDGQTLLSSSTAPLVADALPEGTRLHDLGAHRLRDLSPAERVFGLRTGDLDREFPPVRSLDLLAHNLPVPLTGFVGRSDELAAVTRLVGSERLVTITGPGGAGKTRLAARTAAELADPRRYDGVWWVDLGPVSDPALVAELTASTIGVLVEPVGGPLRALALQLRDRRLLVCLDNCEHLLEASAELTETLLRSCPEVTLLATSREPLGLAGEIVWRVPSLNGDEAVALFVDRASRARPWFTLDATNEAAVRTLCRRLDGIPLAIELAAAWLRTLTPAQIAAGLDDRFALLVRGPRGAVRRQQTLAASMDWSHDLLDETDRVVFRRLAAFAGGFTLDAARAVGADTDTEDGGGPVTGTEVLIALGRLVDKSLVVVDEGGDEARYRLLETVRAYAGDKLDAAGERAAVRERHLDHHLALAELSEPELEAADQDAWLVRLEADHDNFRAALDWGLGRPDPGRGRRLAAALVWLWYKHGHGHEGLDFMRRAIDLAPDDRSTTQARLLVSAAALAQVCGQFPRIVDYAQRALDVATLNDDDRIRGRCLFLLAFVQFYLNPDKSWELCAEARACAERAGDAFTADGAQVVQGSVPCMRDRFEDALPLLREGGERCLRRGDRTFAALALNYQDDIAVLTGDIRLANRLATQAWEIARPLGDYYAVGLSTCHLAFVKGVAGDVDGGLQLMETVVRSIEGADHDVFIPRLGSVLGKLWLWSGKPEAAIGWFERDVRTADRVEADNLIVARSLPGLGTALRHLGRVDEARDAIDRATALARRLDVPHLLAEALDQGGLLLATDDPDAAEDVHHQALALRVAHGLGTSMVDSLDALAGLASRSDSFVEAARLLAASEAARAGMGCPRPPVDRPDHDATLARLRAALADDELATAWAEGAALSLDDAVAYARRSRGARKRPTTGWASLTPTELDVVRLVAEGLTNPEIGARMFISRATVKTHLSHVYAKLGVSNRTELAALATQSHAADV